MRQAWLAALSVLVVSSFICRAARAQPEPAGEPEVQLQGSNVAPPRAVAGPVVTLNAGSSKARLQVFGQMHLWVDVCAPPCRVPVAATGTYRVGGNSIRPSDPFTMPRPSGPVLIDAQLGSTVKRGVGIGLIIGGIANAALGALYYSEAGKFASSTDSNMGGLSKGFYQAVGISGIITGVVLVAIGVPLAMSSTSVEVR